MRVGIYVHIPFCDTRCNYCHFITRPWRQETAERYRRALVKEIRSLACETTAPIETDSIYIGGGTPSLVPPEHILDVLNACRDLFPISADCEITIEVNPGSVTPGKAKAYHSMGVNRISLGAQTFDDRALAAIGRDHTGTQVDETVELLRNHGIPNLSLDLLLGLPQQDERQWESDLFRAIRLEPAHLSLYMLDLDEGSPLSHLISKGRFQIPEDDFICDSYLYGVRIVSNHGYKQYEISNFALPGFESRHNLKYWLRQPVIGFGVGSHSYDGRARYANHSKLSEYFEAVEAGRRPLDWRQLVEERQEVEETLYLGLRLNQGVDWGSVKRTHPGATQLSGLESVLTDLAGKGLVEWEGDMVRLTPRGILLSNEVFGELI